MLSNKLLVNCLPSENLLQQGTLPHTLPGRKSKSGTHVTVWLLFWLKTLYLGSKFSSKPRGFYEEIENVLQEIKNIGFYRLILFFGGTKVLILKYRFL